MWINGKNKEYRTKNILIICVNINIKALSQQKRNLELVYGMILKDSQVQFIY